MSQEFELDGESIQNRDSLLQFLEARAAEKVEPVESISIIGHTFDTQEQTARKLITEKLIYMFCNGGYSSYIDTSAADNDPPKNCLEGASIRPRQSVNRNRLNGSQSLL